MKSHTFLQSNRIHLNLNGIYVLIVTWKIFFLTLLYVSIDVELSSDFSYIFIFFLNRMVWVIQSEYPLQNLQLKK